MYVHVSLDCMGCDLQDPTEPCNVSPRALSLSLFLSLMSTSALQWWDWCLCGTLAGSGQAVTHAVASRTDRTGHKGKRRQLREMHNNERAAGVRDARRAAVW